MATETITYKDDNLDVTLVVSSATVLVGMKRTRLKMAGAELEKVPGDDKDKDKKSPDLDRYILRVSIYPDLVAATTEAEGLPWPLDFEDFLTLPEQLWAAWERAVYRLNPHWIPKTDDPEEKKDSSKSSTSN